MWLPRGRSFPSGERFSPARRVEINIGGVVNRLHVVFNAAVYAERDALTIDGELTDTTKSDRAVSVYLALPVNADGWTWSDDIRHVRRIEGAQEFTNQTPVAAGATGTLSLYPYGCVASAAAALPSPARWSGRASIAFSTMLRPDNL